MALGNNLKRIKKDSLIPAKKGKTTEVKAKTSKPKVKKPVKTKEKSTSKSKIKPATKPKVTRKPVIESKKADTAKKVSKKEIATISHIGPVRDCCYDENYCNDQDKPCPLF